MPITDLSGTQWRAVCPTLGEYTDVFPNPITPDPSTGKTIPFVNIIAEEEPSSWEHRVEPGLYVNYNDPVEGPVYIPYEDVPMPDEEEVNPPWDYETYTYVVDENNGTILLTFNDDLPLDYYPVGTITWLEQNATQLQSSHTLTIDGTDYTIDDNTNLLINSTGLYNSTTSTQVWTYSGDTKFLGFATSSGGVIVYDINDIITLTADLTLYSVQQARMPLYIDGERTDKYHGKVVNKIGDYYVARYEYSITTSVTNGTYSGSTSILVNGTATVTITADSGYELPSSVSVSGASYTYNNGVISLSNPTGDVTISVVCESAVVPMNFATDSWATIASNIKSGNDTYQLGDTKTDTITIGGTNYTVTFKIVDDLVGRYATQSGSSHKVIEMQTIIGPNASSGVAWNSSGSASSFNASDLKSWLDNTAIGYLPNVLQSVLETTTVYSGPGNGVTTNANKVAATGKLFSPCFNEYYGSSASYNWANNYETNSKGQFTYYYNQGVTTSNYSALIKQNLAGSNYYYWLRSPYDDLDAVRVRGNGSYSSDGYYNDNNRVCVCFAW